MSKDVEFKLNMKGLNELMKSGPMQGILNDAAGKIASAAGEGFEVEPAHPISFIAIASVYAATREAKKACSDEKALENAMGGVSL